MKAIEGFQKEFREHLKKKLYMADPSKKRKLEQDEV